MKNHAIVRNCSPASSQYLYWHLQLEFLRGRSKPSRQGTPRAPLLRQQQQTYPEAAPYVPPAKEGFWGHMNPFARKVWVRKQTDPINNRLTELDQVNAKNAADIKDVDQRAQAGIFKAQAAADAANQTATAAGTQAQNANGIAQNASGHVDQLNTTVSGLDKYHQVTDIDVTFHAGNPVLSADAKKQLDDLAAGVTGQKATSWRWKRILLTPAAPASRVHSVWLSPSSATLLPNIRFPSTACTSSPSAMPRWPPPAMKTAKPKQDRATCTFG